MISICGKQLSSSADKKGRDALEGYMTRLQRLQEAKELSSRIRFVVRDVIDMRRNKWCVDGGGGGWFFLCVVCVGLGGWGQRGLLGLWGM